MSQAYAMHVRAFLVLLLTSAAPLLAADVEVSPSGWSSERLQYSSAVRTTVMQLLINPSKFDHRPVRVIGVLSTEFEDRRLYFSTEFYDAFLPQYAIDLRFPSGALAASTRFQGKFVMLEGIFQADGGSMNNGVIDVTLLEIAEERRRGKTR